MANAIDVNFINPFLSAVVEVLSIMANVKATPGKPYLKKGILAEGDVTGVIGIKSITLNGSLAVTFTRPCAVAVISAMLQEPVQDVDALRDGVGELTSIISGNARKGLAQANVRFFATLPSVTYGRRHAIKHAVNRPVLAIPFTTEHGKVTVEVCFASIRR